MFMPPLGGLRAHVVPPPPDTVPPPPPPEMPAQPGDLPMEVPQPEPAPPAGSVRSTLSPSRAKQRGHPMGCPLPG